LRGAGPVFCSGLDLAEAADAERADESARLVAETLRTLYEAPLVTIAVVQGTAVAGGAGLVTACDLAVAERGVEIGYPEVRHGLVAALVSGLLCAQVPRRVARELLLLGQRVDAERAATWGLINRVALPGRGLEVAMEMAAAILRGGPDAILRTKSLLNDFSTSTFHDQLRQALDTELAVRFSEEAREGLAAFGEKRPPRWQMELPMNAHDAGQ
jgi:methylglutaconyl-CoA hydratase